MSMASCSTGSLRPTGIISSICGFRWLWPVGVAYSHNIEWVAEFKWNHGKIRHIVAPLLLNGQFFHVLHYRGYEKSCLPRIGFYR